tara:strand:- start:526 stop:1131 length:606 start_codon:yes stop_codon:yes gene_type:complete
MIKEFQDLIYITEKSLDREFCNVCIDKFEKDTKKMKGLIGEGRIDKRIKQSTDLYISANEDCSEDWAKEDDVFLASLKEQLVNYYDYIPEEYASYAHLDVGEDTGYNMQRTKPGEFYSWHQDQVNQRALTYIWYMNDIVEDGYTEFNCGVKVQPKAGRFLMFPSGWPYLHRGYPPKSETKYICTGWFYSPNILRQRNPSSL